MRKVVIVFATLQLTVKSPATRPQPSAFARLIFHTAGTARLTMQAALYKDTLVNAQGCDSIATLQ